MYFIGRFRYYIYLCIYYDIYIKHITAVSEALAECSSH